MTISFLLKIITDRLDVMISRELADDGVTASQGRVLAYLMMHRNDVITQKDVETYLDVTHATASGLIHRLEQKGWVTTAFDHQDKRIKSVYLTGRCDEIHKQISVRIAEIESDLLQGVTPSERETLKTVLERMYSNLSSSEMSEAHKKTLTT